MRRMPHHLPGTLIYDLRGNRAPGPANLSCQLRVSHCSIFSRIAQAGWRPTRPPTFLLESSQ
jgi:hypothetical protein